MAPKKTARQWFTEAYELNLLEPLSDKSIAAYKKSIQLDDQFTDAYVNLGFIFLNKNEYEKALKYFSKVVQLEPDSIEAYNNLGYVYEKMERFGSAKQMFQKALQLNPNDPE
ncbi:MAG: tetratricopeptide repeat protein, partial [Syntrophorhabdaceae bacterium]|nr:tetratricopeptide repeat protein [Syntrophorhabdaceae bacterium]